MHKETQVWKVRRGGCRRGRRVAGIADAGITDAGVASRRSHNAGLADAGFASQRCLKREICVQVRTRGKRGRGRGFCVALIQKRAERVKGLPRRGVRSALGKSWRGKSLADKIPCCARRREIRPQSKRRVPALSLASGEERGPNPKGVAGLHKVMERG